jgi:isopropylmalate/homocitrate/citramalate synthase
MSKILFNKINSTNKMKEIFTRINPILFDVSLRDGIQNAAVSEYPTEKKIEIFEKIIHTENPQKIEIGSIASPRFLPIMKDTIQLYKQIMGNKPEKTDIYVLVPSISKLNIAIYNNIYNYSFITSTSNAFQLKNTCRTIEKTKADFTEMFERIDRVAKNTRKKLYISCIDHCPIIGQIPLDKIIEELLYYNTHYQFDEICLSDTCGNLTFESFEYIVDNVTLLGMNVDKLALHLHISPHNIDNSTKILKYCFENELNKFDISLLDTGGCSMTIKAEKLLPNLSYELFYKILYEYIDEKMEK